MATQNQHGLKVAHQNRKQSNPVCIRNSDQAPAIHEAAAGAVDSGAWASRVCWRHLASQAQENGEVPVFELQVDTGVHGGLIDATRNMSSSLLSAPFLPMDLAFSCGILFFGKNPARSGSPKQARRQKIVIVSHQYSSLKPNLINHNQCHYTLAQTPLATPKHYFIYS